MLLLLYDIFIDNNSLVESLLRAGGHPEPGLRFIEAILKDKKVDLDRHYLI